MRIHNRLNSKDLAPRARFELATLRSTAEVSKNLSAVSGVAYRKSGAILAYLIAPNPAPMHLSFFFREGEGSTTRRTYFGGTSLKPTFWRSI